MPEPINTDRLTAVRDLLREGRTTEADRALDALQEDIRQEAERLKRETPPPPPQSIEELTDAFMLEVCARLGNPPRLLALLTEIEGKQKAAE